MSDFPPDPLSVIDQLVDHFRNDWRAGKRPRIEDYLAGTPALEGHELFRAFLTAELHERRRQGEAPSSDEYHRRFRQFSALVAAEFTDTQNPLADTVRREPSRPDRERRADAIGAPAGDGETLADRYRILDRLGAGAFGTVYKAQDTRLDRLVAMKTPNFGALGSEGDAQRFLREARAAGQLRHPNIVPVYDAGKIGDSYFIASGLIEGRTLADRLATKGKPAPREAAQLVEKLALALHYAHTEGIVHRDVKPANVMIDGKGEPLIMDFGMARRDKGEELRTQPGMLIGTPAYMSPEQHAGQSHLADARSDQWALGVMLYEMLAGERPFHATGGRRIDDAVRETEPAHPGDIDRSVSRDLGTICLKCLQKEPDSRYPSCQHLAEDLGRWLRGEPIAARSVGRSERVWRWCRRNPVVAGLIMVAAVLVLAVALVAGAGYLSTSRAQNREAVALAASQAEEQGRQEAQARERVERERARTLDDQARTNLYVSKITSARAKGLAGDCDAADRELDACPPELRHWEWGYLKRLCHLDLQTVRLDSDEMVHVAVSSDGQRIAVAMRARGKDKISVCDATTGKQILSLGEQKTPVLALAISPDGLQVASKARHDPIRIWDAATGKTATYLQGLADGGGSLEFSPDGKQIVCGDSKQVTIWTAATGQEIRTLQTEGGNAVAFSPDGMRLATAGSNTVRVWDVEKGTQLLDLRHPGLSVRCLAFSPDGKRLAAGSGKKLSRGRTTEGENFVQIWDATTGNALAALYGHGKPVTSVAFSLDAMWLVTGSADRTVKTWHPGKGQELATLWGHNGSILHVRFSPDPRRVISVSDDRTVKTWDTIERQARAQYRNDFLTISKVVFSPDGKHFALHSPDHIKICDAAAANVEVSIPIRSTNRTGMAFNPDGKQILSGDGGAMASWDTVTGQRGFTFPRQAGGPTSIAFSPDGKYLASGSFKKNLDLRNATNGEKVRTLAEGYLVTSVAFSSDGKRLASAFSDGLITIWDVSSGKDICAIRPAEPSLANVAFSPDGKFLATGVGPLVDLFNAFNGQKILTLRGHGGSVTSLAFSPDGKRIISGSDDASIKIWNTAAGQELLTLAHRKPVTSVDFSPDGKLILSAGHGDGIKLWEAADWKAVPPK